MVFQFASRLPRRPNLILDLYCFSFSAAPHYIQLWDIGLVLFLIFYCCTLYTSLWYWTCIVSVRHSIFQSPFPAACIFAMIHAMLNIWTNFTHVFVKLEILVLGLHSHDDNPKLICNFFSVFSSKLLYFPFQAKCWMHFLRLRANPPFF